MTKPHLLSAIKKYAIVIVMASILLPYFVQSQTSYPKNSTFEFETFLVQPQEVLEEEPEQGFQTADLVAVRVYINNPSNNPIRAARLWLNYPKDKVDGVEVLSNEYTDFDLLTPGENEIDDFNGVIKLGRGITSGELTQEKINFGTFFLRVRSETPNDRVTLDFHGYSNSNQSKAVIHVVDEFLPIRVLPDNAPEPFSFLVNKIDLPETPIVITEPPVETPLPPTPDLGPPNNIIACSEGNDVTFTWDFPESEVDGFYIYYSPESEKYLHRKKLPKVQAYSFTNFDVGNIQYFQISSYQGNNEGPRTDEFVITVGNLPCQPVFSDLSNLIVLKTDILDDGNDSTVNDLELPNKTPETGPNLLLLSIVSGLFFVFLTGGMVLMRNHE